MKRILIFAAYDKRGKIRKNVLDLLFEFRPLVDRILFVADNEADESEQLKLKGVADYVCCRRHGGYDFASYKHGWKTAKSMHWTDDADEVVFCNDSCYAPVFPLAEMFDKMDNTDCDFWGIVKSFEFQPHLQSYFWAVRKRVLFADVFESFMNGIEELPSPRALIVQYEVPMTGLLEQHGFKTAAYIDWNSPLPPTAYPVTLLGKRCPFIKRKVFQRTKYSAESVFKTLKIIKSVNPKLYRDIKAVQGFKTVLLLIKRLMRGCF